MYNDDYSFRNDFKLPFEKSIDDLLNPSINDLLKPSWEQPFKNYSGSIIRDNLDQSLGRVNSFGQIEDLCGGYTGRVIRNDQIQDVLGQSFGRVNSFSQIEDLLGNSLGRITDF